MKIMVFDVPASSGGAVTVLRSFYNRFSGNENEYLFILGNYNLPTSSNITIKNYPWIKNSWIHRLFFDLFVAPRIVKKEKPDAILSLQNLVIPNVKGIYQTIYMHQSIPFSDLNFSIIKNTKYWFIKHVLGKAIIYSVKHADEVIVQTEWIRDACIKKTRVKTEKFRVEKPEIRIDTNNYKFHNEKNRILSLFYPANANSFKNHKVILEMLCSFKEKYGYCPKLVLTISEDMGEYSRALIRFAKKNNLNVEFRGRISYDKVLNCYQKSILVFPSLLETFGLPLLEGKMIGCPIIASDLPYAHEVLQDYPNAYFFNPRNEDDLLRNVESVMKKWNI